MIYFKTLFFSILLLSCRVQNKDKIYFEVRGDSLVISSIDSVLLSIEDDKDRFVLYPSILDEKLLIAEDIFIECHQASQQLGIKVFFNKKSAIHNYSQLDCCGCEGIVVIKVSQDSTYLTFEP